MHQQIENRMTIAQNHFPNDQLNKLSQISLALVLIQTITEMIHVFPFETGIEEITIKNYCF